MSFLETKKWRPCRACGDNSGQHNALFLTLCCTVPDLTAVSDLTVLSLISWVVPDFTAISDLTVLSLISWVVPDSTAHTVLFSLFCLS